MRQWVARKFRSADQAEPVAPPPGPGGDETSTAFSFELTLEAGGLMGPVVNALIGPLLEPAAAELAKRISATVEHSLAHG